MSSPTWACDFAFRFMNYRHDDSRDVQPPTVNRRTSAEPKPLTARVDFLGRLAIAIAPTSCHPEDSRAVGTVLAVATSTYSVSE